MSKHKYKLIYSEIVRLILTNNWPIGSYMKSENELIELFKVSRLTIRNVLSILENEGRIKKSRGKKTLILDRRLRNKYNSEYKDRLINIGLNSIIIDFNLIANNLKNKFTSSKSLYFIKRTRGVKKKIFFISRAMISQDMIGNLTKIHVDKYQNLLDILMIQFNIVFVRSNQELKAINLNAHDSNIFQTKEGIPALSNTWYFYDDKDNLILIDEEISIQTLKVQNTYY